MKKYEFLSERFYKYFQYLRMIAIIGLVLFLGVTAFNTNNDILSIISYFLMILTFVCTVEAILLYVLSLVMKGKGK